MVKPAWAQKRWLLSLEAHCWRFLMGIGMDLHRLAPPRPMRSSFTRFMTSTVSVRHPGGRIKLVFYVPDGYKRRSDDQKYPFVVNFHGGGMTIGQPEDDATWATVLARKTGCVVVAVGYRLAPTHYFPTPVEDGADAILWLVRHSSELGLDPMKITVSGFSAGGNLCFTSPLLLASLKRPHPASPPPRDLQSRPTTASDPGRAIESQRQSAQETDLKAALEPNAALLDALRDLPAYRIVAILAFYPSVNFTTTRTQRRATNTRPEYNLAEFFTDLFDASYLYPASDCDMSHPFLSPGAAPDDLLATLPTHIHFYTAEWDELQAEARAFSDRLAALGKQTRYKMLEGQVHAWDRSPNPMRENPLRQAIYLEASTALSRILQGNRAVDEERHEARVDALHLVDDANLRAQEYLDDKKLNRMVGAETPERLATPEIIGLTDP